MAAKNFKLHFAAAILFFLSLSAFSKEFSMAFSTNLYSIEYNEKSQNLVETINQTLASHFQRILNFWNIKKLDSHINIKIFSTLEDWKIFIESKGQKYEDYIVGCADGPNIFILSYDEYKKTNMHKNDSVDDFQKIIIHEFVHVCNNQICPPDSFIMGEGLATYLADQRYNTNIKIDYSKDDIFNFEKLCTLTNDLYSFSQKIVRILAQSASKEKLIEYACDSRKLYDDWEKYDWK